MDKKTAIIYVRVSTVGQANEELPIESQIERCKAKAAELGVSILQIFRDDGRSGRSDARPAFQAAMRFCELTPPDYLITWSTSRFFRNRIDAALYKRRLDQIGVGIVYISTPIDRSSDSGWMMEGIMEIFDEWYSRQVAADTLRSMIKNAREGYWNGGVPPYGFRSVPAADNPKRRRLEMDEGEAAIVREIYAQRLAGHGARQIAGHLQVMGLYNRRQKWDVNNVLAVLRSEAVIGRLVFGRRDTASKRLRPREQWIVVDSHTPIISVADWEAVQDMIAEASPVIDTGSPHSNWIFTGMLRCAKCGASLQIEGATGRNRRYYYYNCRSAQRTGACENRRLPAEIMDTWLRDTILDIILSPAALAEVVEELSRHCSEWARDRDRRRQACLRHIEAARRKLDNLYELLEDHGKDTPNLGDLTTRLRAHKRTIEAQEDTLAAIDAEEPPELTGITSDAQALAETLREIITTAKDFKKLRSFFKTFIDRIVIEGDTARIEYRPEVLMRIPAPVPSAGKWWPVQRLLGTKIIHVSLPGRLRIAAGGGI